MKAEFFLQKIRDEFPRLKWEKYRLLTHGWDHAVVILDEKLVFRFPKHNEYRDELQNEIRLLRYLKKRVEIGIPDYNYIAKDKSMAGYGMVGGRELTYSRFRRLSTAEKDIVARQLARFVSTMHATPESIIVKYNVRPGDQEKIYKKLVRDTRRFIFPRLRKGDIRLIEEYFDEMGAALGHRYSSVLVHNDLSSDHILWDEKKKQVNVIDFFDRGFGDPAVDFTGLLEYGARFAEKVLGMYSGKKDEQILKRSRLYFKRVPLCIMKDSMEGYPCTFKQGYAMFEKRFKV